MENTDKQPSMEDIVSLAKRRGFVFPGSEIYGGLAGTYDYGPLGSLLKNNIKDSWLKKFVHSRTDMYLVDAAILMNPRAWEASGHVGGFNDPMIECEKCKSRFRFDQLVNEDKYKSFLFNLLERTQGRSNETDLKIEDIKSIFEYKKQSNLLSEAEQSYLDTALAEIEQRNDLEGVLLPILREGFKGVGLLPKIFTRIFKVKCPQCESVNWGEARQFNMMLSTKVGAADDTAATTYLRPETAQGMFVNYKNILDSMSPKIPFGMAQIGKAFRNEITPRDFIFRVREFEQMEIEYFIDPETWAERFEYWRDEMLEWMESVGLDMSKVHELEVADDDRAHYSKRTIDFEFDFPFGRKELYGLAYRTDYDLSKHAEHSKTKLQYTDQQTNKTYVPHVIEPSFGVDRTVLAVLASAYCEDEMNGEKRSFLKLAPQIAPYKIAVSPLLKNKEQLVDKALSVFGHLKATFGNVIYDDNGNIGKRYRRQDEIGTPFCVVIDFETLEGDPSTSLGVKTSTSSEQATFDKVTVRDRDTGTQKRVALGELENYFKEKLSA